MAQLNKGHTYHPGDTVDAASLNNLVDLGTGVGGLIFDQDTALPDPDHDFALFWDASAPLPNRLRKCLVAALPDGVTSIGFSVDPIFQAPGTPNPINTAHPVGDFQVVLKSQLASKVLVAPVDVTGTPTFRKLESRDMTLPTSLISLLNINWDLGNVFCKTLPAGTGPFTFTFSNASSGQTIKVRIRQNTVGNGRVNWNVSPAIVWAEGTEPELPTVGNQYGVYVFTAVFETGIGQRIHGYLEGSWNDEPGVESANTFLAGPISGADAVPAFRELAPADLPNTTVVVTGTSIDWSLGNTFRKHLTATTTMTFANPSEGQTITLLMDSTGAFNLNFPAGVLWAGGTVYPATHSGRDIVIFRYISSNYWGNYLLNFV